MATTVIKDEFKVTIERVVTTEFLTEKDILVEERHYTDKEITDSHRWMEADERHRYLKKIYGKIDALANATSTDKVFQQTIDAKEIDIKKIIGAINDLKP